MWLTVTVFLKYHNCSQFPYTEQYRIWKDCVSCDPLPEKRLSNDEPRSWNVVLPMRIDR